MKSPAIQKNSHQVKDDDGANSRNDDHQQQQQQQQQSNGRGQHRPQQQQQQEQRQSYVDDNDDYDDNDNNNHDDDDDGELMDINILNNNYPTTTTTTSSSSPDHHLHQRIKKTSSSSSTTNHPNINKKNYNHITTLPNGNHRIVKNPITRRGVMKNYYDNNTNRDIMIAVLITFLCTVIGMIVLFPLLLLRRHGGGVHNPSLSYNTNNMEYDPSLSNNDIKAMEEENILGLTRLPFLLHTYRVPEAMETVGDRSLHYAQLRQLYDTQVYPKDLSRSLSYVQSLQQDHPSQYITSILMDPKGGSSSSSLSESMNSDQNIIRKEPSHNHGDQITHVPYDIHHCPEEPPIGYPYQWNLLEILTNWPTDDTSYPDKIHQGLCIFDYSKDYDKAITYREKEVPFVVINDPEVARTVERWHDDHYMEQLLGNVLHRTEYSNNNHFMYYVPPTKADIRNNQQQQQQRHRRNQVQRPEGWKEPTKMMHMKFIDWLLHANGTKLLPNIGDGNVDNHNHNNLSEQQQPYDGPDRPHWYYRLIGCGGMGNDGSCDRGSSEYLFDELPFFQPKSSLYIVDPMEQKGIHCRFGMRGVIAEDHFDGSRNVIVVLQGHRRYILSHPHQCHHLALYPKGHPSARHSAVDWSHPSDQLEEYPSFREATANELILSPGQVLYLPTDWFHYIVSLDINYQCNTRSGITNDYTHYIHECGF